MSAERPTRAASAGTRLDPWFGSYADRTLGMKASEIRALFSVANRPEVVSLAGGMPHLGALPLDQLGSLANDLVTSQGLTALQYGSGQGDEKLRTHICEVMAIEDIEAHPDDIVVTTGSQQALDLVTRIFIDPGDVIVAEAPSYVGALGVFRSYQAEVVHAIMDEHGLIPEAFEKAITESVANGKRVKFLYTVPNFHNPAGVSLSVERRPTILEIAKRHSVLVVEDNPYGLLGFNDQVYPAIRSLDDDGVIYLGSFSKTFAPGYRVGWALAPHAVREKLVLASESAILCPSNFAQLSISTYLEHWDWRAQIKSYRAQYLERRDAMLNALENEIPTASWNVPQGGFYVWVALPEGLDAPAMLPRAVSGRVAYVPGTAFYADGRGHSHVRLSFCFPTPERIREGVRRLASVIDAEVETITVFGSSRTPETGPPGVQTPAPDLS